MRLVTRITCTQRCILHLTADEKIAKAVAAAWKYSSNLWAMASREGFRNQAGEGEEGLDEMNIQVIDYRIDWSISPSLLTTPVGLYPHVQRGLEIFKLSYNPRGYKSKSPKKHRYSNGYSSNTVFFIKS